jgi:hypothetical protein
LATSVWSQCQLNGWVRLSWQDNRAPNAENICLACCSSLRARIPPTSQPRQASHHFGWVWGTWIPRMHRLHW